MPSVDWGYGPGKCKWLLVSQSLIRGGKHWRPNQVVAGKRRWHRKPFAAEFSISKGISSIARSVWCQAKKGSDRMKLPGSKIGSRPSLIAEVTWFPLNFEKC